MWPAGLCWCGRAAWSAICATLSRWARVSDGYGLLEMTPESLRLNARLAPALIMAGYCAVHLLEHTINAHFHFGEETHAGEFVSARTGYSVLGGLSVHALFDGVAIGSGFALSNWLGWLIFLAILLHKAPEGFTMASVMMASGRSRGRHSGPQWHWPAPRWWACW
jgi:zinc transporter ZupT